MRRLVLLGVPAAALVLVALHPRPAAATLPVIPSGSSVGESRPLKAYATVSPAVHLFGDTVTARIAVVADTKWVDPARLRVTTDFRPYRSVVRPTTQVFRAGRFAQVTWTWTLRCTTSPCVPRVPPSDKFHVFRFQLAHISYLLPSGKRAYGITATWPKVEVMSQISPGVVAFLQQTSRLNWRFHLAPVAAPTYRISPTLLFRVALAAGIALFLCGALLVARWFRTIRPPKRAEADVAAATTLERALAVLAWAHERGDETLERKALERVAGELVVEAPEPTVDELSRTARELAWSSRTPEDDEVETFSERARDTRRPPPETGADE